MQMPTWVSDSWSHEKRPLGVAAHSGPPVEHPDREAKVLSEALKITQPSMIKRRRNLGVNLTGCFRFPPSVCLSHTPPEIQPLSKNKKTYIFLKRSVVVLPSIWLYNNGIVTGTTIPDESGSGSNDNKGELHTPPDLQHESVIIICSIVSYLHTSFWGRSLSSLQGL